MSAVPVASDRVAFWKNKKYVAFAPVAATMLLEYANVGQIVRMWTEQTAAGQSMWSWVAVFLALWCYNQFYRVCLPDQRWAIRMNMVGMAMNVIVVGTIIYFRYFVV